MNWLKAYFQAEKEKLKGYHGRALAEYIWQYYKLWIIAIVFVIVFTGTTVYHRLTTPLDNWFYITFANTSAEVDNGSQMWEDFVAYSGYDVTEKNVYFNNNCFFKPDEGGHNQYYDYFCAYVDAGTLDLITMERDDLAELGRKGRLLDLSREEADFLTEKYADRLIYALPYDTEYSTEEVPIGIDISDSRLVTEYHVYPESCAIGLSANFSHPEAVEKFMDFILEEDAS